MSYIALYRKWRPMVFEDVVEQEHVVRTLKNSVKTGRIGHAYLFCGTRGTGKTTVAKIFSRAINCKSPVDGDPCNRCEICTGILSGGILDVMEIDAASNNSVDNIREIRDEVVYTPAQATYKVYIIDEVHMLSAGAFNALLKTLEEPPRHVVFLLATTEPHKLPATILSRCQRFDFKRITVDSIKQRLEKISAGSAAILDKEAARLIARLSDGALRDAISILDQCISLGGSKISYEDVLSVVGMVNDYFIGEVIDAVGRKDIQGILKLVEKLVSEGKDMSVFVSDLVQYYRNLLVCKFTSKPSEIIEAPPDMLERMKKQAEALSREGIINSMKELSALEAAFRWAGHPRVLLEVALMRLCEDGLPGDNAGLEQRVAALERKLEGGNIAMPADLQYAGTKAGNSSPAVSAAPGANAGAPAAEPEAGCAAAESVPATGGKPEKPAGGVKELEIWGEILEEIKAEGKPALYMHLSETKAVEIGKNLVGVIFDSGNGFNRMFASTTENMDIMEKVIAKRLGRAIKVKCLDESDMAGEKAQARARENDEFLETAQDLANRLDVPLDIIDG